jgi:hypothetical protein
MEQHCALCGKYIHRSDDPITGKDGRTYHAHCYSRVKDKLEKDYEKKGFVSKIKRSFRQPEAYLDEVKKVYNTLLKEEKATLLQLKFDPTDFGYKSMRQFFNQTWDKYGFDWDTRNNGVIWPINSLEELKAKLDKDEIEYEEFEADLDRYFKESRTIKEQFGGTCDFSTWAINTKQFGPNDGKEIREWVAIENEDDLTVYCAYNYGRPGHILFSVDRENNDIPSDIVETCMFEVVDEDWFNRMQLSEDYDEPEDNDEDDEDINESKVIKIKLSELKKIVKEQSENTLAFSQGFKAGKSDAQEGKFNKTENPYRRYRPTKSSEMRKLAAYFKEWAEGYESGYRWSEAGPP